MKKLSIYIPTYNRKEYLKRQLEFIFSDAEGYLSEIEVIVSDNASDDGTKEMVEALQQKYEFTYYRNKENLGIVANTLAPEKYCKGEFLWVVGDDDYIVQGLTKKIFWILREHPDINLIFFNHALLNGTTMDYGVSFPVMPENLCKGYMENGSPFTPNDFEILGRSVVHILRKEIWSMAVRLVPLDTIESHGLDLIAPLAAIKAGKSYFDPEVSIYYNCVNNSWKNDAFRAFYGTQLSILKLKELGYAESEILQFYKARLEKNLATLYELRLAGINEEKIIHAENVLLQYADYSLDRRNKREIRCFFPCLDFFRNKRVVIYGAGRIGSALYRTCKDNGIEVIAWCDRNYKKLQREGKKVDAPEIIANLDYDLVLDAVGDPETLDDIFSLLLNLGVEKSKIKVTFSEYKMILDKNM